MVVLLLIATLTFAVHAQEGEPPISVGATWTPLPSSTPPPYATPIYNTATPPPDATPNLGGPIATIRATDVFNPDTGDYNFPVPGLPRLTSPTPRSGDGGDGGVLFVDNPTAAAMSTSMNPFMEGMETQGAVFNATPTGLTDYRGESMQDVEDEFENLLILIMRWLKGIDPDDWGNMRNLVFVAGGSLFLTASWWLISGAIAIVLSLLERVRRLIELFTA
ncbi:MAG: hypothetical protein AAF125_19930 [Chloroflexota bacterium]